MASTTSFPPSTHQPAAPAYVDVRSLAKRYGTVRALVDCSLEVYPGEILGLLGPNGAGKSTLLRILTGYLRPSKGSARIDRFDCYRQSLDVRRRVSYLPADARLLSRLSGRRVIDLLCRLRETASADRAVELAKRLGLPLERRVNQMSTGMRQQLALAITLAAKTPLIILDEPTANLDPSIRRIVLNWCVEARNEGRALLFSSHVLSEVEEISDRVALLKEGKVAEVLRMDQLRKQHIIRARLRGDVRPAPADLSDKLHIERQGDRIQVRADGDLAPLLNWLAQQPLVELQVEPVGLAEHYERLFPTESL